MAELDVHPFIKMFGCDTARIYTGVDHLFLIIGEKRNTKDDEGQWHKNGEPLDFNYVAEKVVASGRTEEELMESALEYKRLNGISVEDYLAEIANA